MAKGNPHPDMSGLRPGQGRNKGIPNKVTRTMKAILEEAANAMAADPKLNILAMARRSQVGLVAAHNITSKLLPVQLTGDKDNPVVINITSDRAAAV